MSEIKPTELMGATNGSTADPAAQFGEYEFSPSENRIIGKAALWAKILAIVMFVQAGVEILNSMNAVSAGIYVTVGIFYLLGAKALKGVVETAGNDVTLMMSALKRLGVAFLIRIIVTAITAAVIITILIVVVAVVVASR
jgi:hypothetical protein